MQLDKEDTRRSNLNGKCVFNILPDSFVCFCSISYCGVKPDKCFKSG